MIRVKEGPVNLTQSLISDVKVLGNEFLFIYQLSDVYLASDSQPYNAPPFKLPEVKATHCRLKATAPCDSATMTAINSPSFSSLIISLI